MENLKQELIRRQQMILCEPDGIVRETMIENLTDGLFEESRLNVLLGENKNIPILNPDKMFKKYSNRQREIIQRLEFLVHRRYTAEDLNKYLSLHFYEEIEVSDVTANKDDCDTSDFNWMFNSVEKDTFGYFDIYFLPTREPNVFLITEVGFEFE